MPQAVEITIKRTRVGKLEFVESEEGLRRSGARRTADGFLLTIPAKLTLDWQGGPWQPMVSNLRAIVFCDDGSSIELGVAHDLSLHMAANPRLERDIALEWRGRSEVLALAEKRRNGRQPKFWIQVYGEAYPTFSTNQNALPDVRGVSERIYGDSHVEYPRDAWVFMMNNVMSTGSFLVEIPLRQDLPAAWGEIFKALEEAKRNLSLGGDDSWKACVGAIRLALETWRDLEAEDQGPGWNAPSVPHREARTKSQRVDAIRWHLLQLAHLSPHSSADNWTRNDAVLAFAVLAALLAERDP